MLQLKFDAELAIEVGVEWILQNFPFCLVAVLLFQITKKLLICWSFFFLCIVFVCLFVHSLVFLKKGPHQISFVSLIRRKIQCGLINHINDFIQIPTGRYYY